MLEWAAWFLVDVWLVPIIGYLPMTLIFAPALTWRMGYRTRLVRCMKSCRAPCAISSS